MKTLTILLIIFLFNINLLAQQEKTVFGKPGLRITGVWGGPVVGLGQVNDNLLVIRGGFGGIEFGKKLFIGWGGYETDNDVYLDALDNDQIKMNYSGFMLGYTPKAHKTLHPNFTILAGTGRAQVDSNEEDNLFIIQPTVGLEINLFRFFHLSWDTGYRWVTNVNIPGVASNDFSNVYTEIKMKFGFSW